MRRLARSYQTAAERWAGVGPYYAMFPGWFSNAVIEKFTEPGDAILDPFAGRGTAVFSAATRSRVGIGVEINPVGWVYARTKLKPAPEEAVRARILNLGSYSKHYRDKAKELPEFFKVCFTVDVRAFLLAARSQLDWKRSSVDRTVMALLLVHLHGKRADSLSNQLRQTKAMSPDYAIRWWRERGLKPPDHDPIAFLFKKLDWRYAKGTPELTASSVYLGDSLRVLPRLRSAAEEGEIVRPRLLLTSPPYHDLANYHYDQWLRLWLLGGAPHANRNGHRYRGKFGNLEVYQDLLSSVFKSCADIMHRQSTVYVRTSGRRETYKATITALQDAFPRRTIRRRPRPFRGPTQTHLFGDATPKKGEVDIVLLS